MPTGCCSVAKFKRGLAPSGPHGWLVNQGPAGAVFTLRDGTRLIRAAVPVGEDFRVGVAPVVYSPLLAEPKRSSGWLSSGPMLLSSLPTSTMASRMGSRLPTARNCNTSPLRAANTTRANSL